MNGTKDISSLQKKEFDYFYTLLKNWKIIFFSCLAFVLIGLVYIISSPKVYTAKSTFTINLNNELNTTYGSYELKTEEPLHYLALLEQKGFKDSVLEVVGSEEESNFSFEIEEEEVKANLKNTDPVFPNKFVFLVSGRKKETLPKISEAAFSMFLEDMDRNIQNDMFKQFSSSLKIQIDNYKFDIDLKEKLIGVLKKGLEGGIQIKTDKTNFKEVIDDRLINSLEGSDKGLMISMMMNGNQGSQYYQETILTVEEIQLKTMRNSLEKDQLLLEKLIENNENGTLASIFNLPFSNSYFLLTSPEYEKVSSFSKYVKHIVILLFLGGILSVTYILLRGFYNFYYKNR